MVSRRQHLRHAAIIWVFGGIFLLVRGLSWVLADAYLQRFLLACLTVCLLAGLLKGGLVLTRTAQRAIGRIQLLDDRTPVWKLFSLSMYLLLGGMITLGIFCRLIGGHFHLYGVLGLVNIIIGVALLTGSTAYWRAWYA